MRKLFYNRNGITLVEIIAAIAIMGIAFASLLSLFAMSHKNSALAKEKSEVIAAAQGLIEYSCKEYGFESLNIEADGQPRVVSDKLKDIYIKKYEAVRVTEVVREGLLKVQIKIKKKTDVNYDSGAMLVTQLAMTAR